MLNKVGTQQINYFYFSLLVLGARGNLDINGKQLWLLIREPAIFLKNDYF